MRGKAETVMGILYYGVEILIPDSTQQGGGGY